MDLTADNEESRHFQTQLKKWDRKKKKMITVDRVCMLFPICTIFVYHEVIKITYYVFEFNRRIQKQERYVPSRVCGYLLRTRRIVTACGKRRVRSTKLTKTIARRSLRKCKNVSQSAVTSVSRSN